jgi:double-strand break repair protein MRE11
MSTLKADENTLRILIATDNHLGYNEKDPVRGNDSFDAFEEILKYARDLDVDMMVLGGDLFHDNKPSRKTIHTTMQLFRHYCFGDRESQLEYLSDASLDLHSPFGRANYLDPNLNISLPVFAIHGNHDDPTGDGNLSTLDLLSTTGLINYFGRCREVDDITVAPIILRKGNTHLALYGLGNIRDERLHRTFMAGKVKMLRPQEQQESPNDWFNLMLFHQNRAAHGATSHIPETFLDDFLDLIVWGHEHDCRIDPVYIPQRDFYILQPGSSCITSLSEGEAIKKHVALLTVRGSEFELTPLPLKSIRPFAFGHLSLSSLGLEVGDTKGCLRVVIEKIESMIANIKAEYEAENRGKTIPLPLIRLCVDHSGGYQAINPHRLGQLFQDKVANPREIVHAVRKRATAIRSSKPGEQIRDIEFTTNDGAVRVEDLVSQYLASQKLDLLPQNEFSDCVRIFVEKDDKDAIEAFLKKSLSRINDGLGNNAAPLEMLRQEIERVRLTREEEWKRINPNINDAVINHRVTERIDDDINIGSDDDIIHENTPQPVSATRGRGRGRGRGTTATPRGASRAAASRPPLSFSSQAATQSPKRSATHLDDDDVLIPASQTTNNTQLSTQSVIKETLKSRWPTRGKK